MKAVFAVLAPAVLLAPPSFANANEDILNQSLASATRQEMSVAPWVRISVASVVRGDKLIWVATTSARQRYACASPASADAVLSRDQVACVRVAPSRSQLVANSNARNYSIDRTTRARLPYPGQYPEGAYGISTYRPL